MQERVKKKFAFLRDLLSKKSRNSLSIKLIVAIGTLVLIGSSIFWYMIIIRGERDFISTAIHKISACTDLMEQSLKANMMRGHLDVIQEILEEIGTSENILEINIYKHPDGKISFSAHRENLEKKLLSDSSSCTLCHQKEKKAKKLEGKQWVISEVNGEKVLKLAIPIVKEKGCTTGKCHTDVGQKSLMGILEADYSLSDLDLTLKRQKIFTLTFGIIFTFFCCVVLCIILWKLIIKPITLLAEGMEKVTKGELDHRIEINTKDEMGMLARTFNEMTKELKVARERLENWAKELEEEVKKKTEEIRKGQEQMIHTEKLASLGRMAAGVAHELNSPLTGIVTFAHLMLQRIPPENKMDREDLEVIIEQAERCSKIIKGLLGFSRALPAEKSDIRINDTIRHVIDMVKNQAKFHNIKIITDLSPDLPEIKGDASQIQQVYMNLLINAADAMNDRGEIRIATRLIKEDGVDYIEIEFTDNGPGIPEEYMGRLFEPFFTTKPVGKGTGLGLSVSHGIVRKHGGHIIVKSKVGEGTTFLIRLPVRPESKEG
jgi:two-component system NtrC family sensor kinase